MTKIRILTAAISMFGLLLAPAAFAEQPMKPGETMESTPTRPSEPMESEKTRESTPTQPSEMKGKAASIFKARSLSGK
jgi:hypothetical protein